MRNVAIATDLVRGIDDHDPFSKIVSEHTTNLAEHRCLAHTGSPEEKDALPQLDYVTNDVTGPVNRSSDAQSQTDHFSCSVPQRGDSMERALDAGTIVASERTDVRNHIRQVLSGHFTRHKGDLASWESCLRRTTEIHYNLEKALESVDAGETLMNVGWKRTKQSL
jgi:hypothetical protein